MEDTLRLINNSSVNPFHIILSGTGSAGVLTAIPSAPDFGQVLIGNSSLLISKIYPLTGLVVVDSARLLVNTHYGIDSTKQVLDTMFVYLKFTPTILGTIRDTLLIFNNSSVNPFTLALSGTGKANTAPNAFNVKPVAGALTNDLTPTLTWEGRGDVDGDAVTYTLEVSKNANMSSPQVTQGGLTDTTFTLGSNLDQVALYYFRVTATDTRGGSTLSNTGFFRTDAQAPVAAIGALTLKVVPIKKYLQVYVATSEKLKT
ncbi:MAG: fibronectin type III domain-containing protein, partial [Paludibacter sp.]